MRWLADCYHWLHPRRAWLGVILLLLCSLCVWGLSRLQLEESIVAMLPDGQSRVANDFQLLQKAPFARKLVIHLRAEDAEPGQTLLRATDLLRDALPPDLFLAASSGPEQRQSNLLFEGLGDFLPVLLDQADLARLEEQLDAQQIDRQLAANLALLLQPQGIALQDRIRRDPLDLQRLALEKLRFLNPLPGARLEQGYFLSQDGRSSLILADTPVAITDAAGSEQLLVAFARAKQGLPQRISAELLSGHQYTRANSRVIKEDMRRVLLVSTAGILLLFLLLLRSLRALAVFLLPVLSMLVALVVAAGWFGRLSGITVGFGAVLLGITIDYALHVYFALREGQGERGDLLSAVSRPVLFGAMTSLAAFAVLLGSELPGQRQLAMFSMAGILAALLLALLVLPHFLGPGRSLIPDRAAIPQPLAWRPGWPRMLVAGWLLVLLASVFGLQKLSINGELRQLGYLPAELQQAEQSLAEQWGDLRGRAMLFVSAPDLETALQRNEQVWALLSDLQVQSEAVSLAPLLSSRRTQLQRSRDWATLWRDQRLTTEVLVRERSKSYGFSSEAFTPFFEGLDLPPRLLDTQQLRDWGLAGLLDSLLLKEAQEYRLLTLFPDRPELLRGLDRGLARIPGATLVSQSRFGEQLSAEIGADFVRFILCAGLAMLLLLILLFRRGSDVLLALLPVLTGLLVMFGGMGWLGLEINLFNVVASILIIGLGVDYGIFMVCQQREQVDLASGRAVLVSGLTTLVGFGALVLARHPALHSIGLTVLLGISAAMPTAVLVIPALRRRGL